MIIDARGQLCPKPVMLLAEEIAKIKEGIVEVIVDNAASADNLVSYAKGRGFYCETTKDGSDWRVKVVNGYTCSPVVGIDDMAETEESLLVVVATDTMGKDEVLGKILMKAYFESIKTYKQLPHTIFFLNAGVRLTTVEEDICPIIKDIEELGVEIYSCGTCLKYYGLESELKTGHRGTTNHIVEGAIDFVKTIWIG